jgi:hypothetical protein
VRTSGLTNLLWWIGCVIRRLTTGHLDNSSKTRYEVKNKNVVVQ